MFWRVSEYLRHYKRRVSDLVPLMTVAGFNVVTPKGQYFLGNMIQILLLK